jgi:flagellin-like hook-associated protein FlgL
MASDITLSKGVRSNLLSLQSTAELLGRTQERLSTGKKVNSALDNPINFFTSAGLSSRANDLSALLDSVGNGVQTINAADKGITAIKKLIESAQATARQALTAGEGTTTYAVSQTGNVAVTADTAATGTGTVAIQADVAAVTGGNVFAAGTPAAPAELTLDTSNIASGTDGQTIEFVYNGTTYTFENDEGTNGVAGANIGFDGTEAGLAAELTTLFGPAGTEFTGTVVTDPGVSITVTAPTGSTNDFSALVDGAGIDLSEADDVPASTFTVDDGTGGAVTFTYVSAGANAATGTFTTLNDLRDAINHANAGLDVTASAAGNALRLVGDTNAQTITVGGDMRATLGFAAPAYTAANSGFNSQLAALAGQSLEVDIGSTNATVNITAATTRASLMTGLGGIAALNGSNQIQLTAGNNADDIVVSGAAAAALGFGGANDEFGPTNAQVTGFTGQLTFQLGSGAAQSIEFGNGANGEIRTRADLAARLGEINTALTGVTLSIDGGGNINVASTSSEDLTIGGTAAASFGLTATTYAPTETFTANATRASLQADFNNLLGQITTLAQDASYNGVNLLNGDNLSVIFNEDGSSSLSINGVDFSASGLGLTIVTGSGFQSNTAINASLAQLDTATATLRTQSSRFGSNLSIVQTRQDFTKNLISVLQTGADQLVLADTNEEGANMLALQTRQQLSSVALSMASQADQNVLRLF